MLKIKEEYNKRREEIYYMIHDAYMDKCILEYIERINKLVKCGEMHFESNSKHVMQHMIYLTISDLVLNICKICHDKERNNAPKKTEKTEKPKIGEKTAINKMEKCLNELLKEENLASVEVVGKNLNKYVEHIEKLAGSRNKVIAHNDLDKNEEQNIGTDDIQKIYKLLDRIIDVYNQLSDISVNGKVIKITDDELEKIKFEVSEGLRRMMSQVCYRKTSNSLQGEDGNGSKS
ncbi:MAG: hypothetical protein ACLSFE_05890 [Christensenellales bacterium]|jgi:hypothetical protein